MQQQLQEDEHQIFGLAQGAREVLKMAAAVQCKLSLDLSIKPVRCRACPDGSACLPVMAADEIAPNNPLLHASAVFLNALFPALDDKAHCKAFLDGRFVADSCRSLPKQESPTGETPSSRCMHDPMHPMVPDHCIPKPLPRGKLCY